MRSDATHFKSRVPHGSPIFAHACALGVLLLILVPLVTNGWPALPDEGLYTAQADALANGAWARQRAAPSFDQDGRWTALVDATIVGDSEIPYARRPAYPLLLTPFWAVGGITGTILLSVLGTWAAALFSGLVATRIDRRAAIPTLWLVGAGSPLLFDAFVVVGHSVTAGLSAALAWLTVTAATRSPDRPARGRPLVVVMVIITVIALTLVRTEGVIIVGGLAIGLAATAIGPPHRRRSLAWSRLALPGVMVAFGAATYIVNVWWGTSITGLETGDFGTSSRQPNYWNTVWTGVIRPWYGDNRAASASMTLVLVTSLLAPLALRFLPKRYLLGMGLLMVGAGAAVVRSLSDAALVTGILPTAPWLLIGLLSLSLKDLKDSAARICSVAAGIAFIAIATTSYGDGGAAEWGGRFFHPIIPLLAPVAVVGLIGMLTALPPLPARTVATTVAVMTAAISLSALRVNTMMHDDVQKTGNAVIEASKATGSDVIAIAMLHPDGSPRSLWQVQRDGVAVLAAPGLDGIRQIVNSVPSGRNRIAFITNFPDRKLLTHLLSKAKDPTWKVDSITDLPGENVSAVLVTRLG